MAKFVASLGNRTATCVCERPRWEDVYAHFPMRWWLNRYNNHDGVSEILMALKEAGMNVPVASLSILELINWLAKIWYGIDATFKNESLDSFNTIIGMCGICIIIEGDKGYVTLWDGHDTIGHFEKANGADVNFWALAEDQDDVCKLYRDVQKKIKNDNGMSFNLSTTIITNDGDSVINNNSNTKVEDYIEESHEKKINDLARRGLEYIIDISEKNEREYGIFMILIKDNINYKYRLFKLVQGTNENIGLKIDKEEYLSIFGNTAGVVGIIHTHHSKLSNEFSAQDLLAAYENKVPIYLRHTKQKQVRKWVPPKHTDEINSRVQQYINNDDDKGLFRYFVSELNCKPYDI